MLRLEQKSAVAVDLYRRWLSDLRYLLFNDGLPSSDVGTGDLDILQQDLFLACPLSRAGKSILPGHRSEEQKLAKASDEGVVKVGFLHKFKYEIDCSLNSREQSEVKRLMRTTHKRTSAPSVIKSIHSPASV